MKFICKVVHGSRLYKLHDENSDHDEKGIFLNPAEDHLLGRAAKNINSKIPELNKEIEYFSLQEFLKHASHGEGYAIDMLHCSDEDVIEDSTFWHCIRCSRSQFYTKKMSGLVGYCKNQAVKYALKAERLNAVKLVLAVLKDAEEKGVAKMYHIWDDLPRGEHIYFDIELRNNNKDNRYIEVAGKKLPATIAITYGIDILERLVNSFGDRVKKAAEMDEKDLKSLSHSFRTGFQLQEIYEKGDFSYPLPQSEFLKAIKYRKLDYGLDKLDEKLHDLVSKVEELSLKSPYPDTVDQEWLDNLILAEYNLK